jgi:hypothetical protein
MRTKRVGKTRTITAKKMRTRNVRQGKVIKIIEGKER